MKKVLVVEDDIDNLALITYALERGGYEVIAAQTGEIGLELAIKEKPYFIIMDISLPGIDGLETARRIRQSKIDHNIPIIAITSFAMKGDMEKAINAGCNAYFEKPIDPLTIVDEIHKIILRSAK